MAPFQMGHIAPSSAIIENDVLKKIPKDMVLLGRAGSQWEEGNQIRGEKKTNVGEMLHSCLSDSHFYTLNEPHSVKTKKQAGGHQLLWFSSSIHNVQAKKTVLCELWPC